MGRILTPNLDKPILGDWQFVSSTVQVSSVAVAAGVTASPGTTILTAPVFTAQWPTSLKLTAKAIPYNTAAGTNILYIEIYDVTNAAVLDRSQSSQAAAGLAQTVALQAITTPAVGVATTYRITCWHSGAIAGAVVRTGLIIDQRRITA